MKVGPKLSLRPFLHRALQMLAYNVLQKEGFTVLYVP